jgi:hypothetical protein
MTPEKKARQEIDAQLVAAGWVVQTKANANLSARRGVAICELSFATGEPDYTLSANLQRAVRLRQSILQRAFAGAL